MIAEQSLPSGSPADIPVRALDDTGRFVQIGNLRTVLPSDWSIILATLLSGYGRVVSYDHLLNRLYLDQNRPEPETSRDALKVKVSGLRKLGLVIRNIHDCGYTLVGVNDEFLDSEGAEA